MNKVYLERDQGEMLLGVGKAMELMVHGFLEAAAKNCQSLSLFVPRL